MGHQHILSYANAVIGAFFSRDYRNFVFGGDF